MRLATSDGKNAACALCPWKEPVDSLEAADRVLREHLADYHRRVLIAYVESSRKGKVTRSWEGPRQ